MVNITGKQIEEIIKVYSTNNSILKTAEATGVSTVKVRKILITEGLWESDTSIRIGNLLKQGLTTEKIAEILYMSVKNVQAYMPYERGVYGVDELSSEAIRADKYRNRMKKAASMQVIKKTQEDNTSERIKEVADDRIIKISPHDDDRPDVLKLHLELNMEYVDEEELQTLRKYGSMNEAISRDILVPADITLHALNYAILRMFGWQNGHLHNFSLPESIFRELTENQFNTWSKMAGVYFRFPTENFEDIYWDDDYRKGESIRSWMKKKYTGPYKYRGYGEHYLMNQMEVQDMFSRWDEITVREFKFGAGKQLDPYNVKLKEATIDQVTHAFADVTCHELIERVPLADILYEKNKNTVDFTKIRTYLDSKIASLDVNTVLEEFENKRFKSMKAKREFLEKYNIPVLPITDQLIYSYDYGDGWKVRIHCENAYKLDKAGAWKDMQGETVDATVDNFKEVMEKHRPICIAKDGIELVDDVGGIGGFCRMLQTIYECDINDEESLEERENMLGWADMMGWTGRKISPKQTL